MNAYYPGSFYGWPESVRVHHLANIATEELEVGEGTRIDAFVTITGKVKIGKYCHISTGSSIFGSAGFEMGDYSGISPGVQCFTSTEDLSGRSLIQPTVKFGRKPISAPVRMGSHCSIGANSVILPGADIPDGAVSGCLTLIKRKLEPWTIYAGIPARAIGERTRDSLKLAEAA